MYFKSFANSNSYSTSHADPMAICKNLAKSLLELLPQPSDMLIGIDDDALRICEVNP